jgi:hypothetical protein
MSDNCLQDSVTQAYESLLLFLRTAIDLPDGVAGVVMAIHTFGDYPEKYHPHLHAIVTDGLFTEKGDFCVMPKVDSKPLEESFRAMVFATLKEEEKITEELIDKLMNWNHSGFSVHKGEQIARDDEIGRRVAGTVHYP